MVYPEGGGWEYSRIREATRGKFGDNFASSPTESITKREISACILDVHVVDKSREGGKSFSLFYFLFASFQPSK